MDDAATTWLTPETPLVNSVETVMIEPELFTRINIVSNEGETLVTVYLDGRVEFGPHYNPTEAARSFWENLAKNAPCASPVSPDVEAAAKKIIREHTNK